MKSCLIFLISFFLLAKCSDFNFPTSESDDESDFNKKYELERSRIENMTIRPARTTIKPKNADSIIERNNFVAPIICPKGSMYDNRFEECKKIS